MADLIDMAKSAEQKAKEALPYDAPEKASSDVPDYPWGLSINLDHEGVKRLGLEGCEHDGKPLNITAVGVITECASNSYNGEIRKTMSIQLQKMSVAVETEKVDPVQAMYGDGRVNTVSLDG